MNRTNVVRFLTVSIGALSVAASPFCLAGCSNPYDPLIGGRDPRPGAERYLSSRSDIPKAEKSALLDYHACAPELLARLAEAPSREVRSLVAANPSVSTATLEKLLHDAEPGVRGFIAVNRKTQHAMLLKLKDDPDYHVGWILPGNPNWRPEEIRQMYARMRSEEATSRPAFTSPSVFAGNPTTPADILEQLSTSDSYFEQIALANNPSIPPKAAERLAKSGESSVRKMLISNKATPKAVLGELAADPDPEVRRSAKAAVGH